MSDSYIQYRYDNALPGHAHSYLWPCVSRTLERVAPGTILDLGCGSGSVTHRLSEYGKAMGVDASVSGITQARLAYPLVRFEVGSVYDNLSDRYGTFDAVVSLEVVEHLYEPRAFARTLFGLIRPGGHAIVSTPFHGYIKNLFLAASGRMDAHFTALWDGGHIKFWSVRTLTILLREAGFTDIAFSFAGRSRWLAKSMIATARRPV